MSYYEGFCRMERILREEYSYDVWDIISAGDLSGVERGYKFAAVVLYAMRKVGRRFGSLPTQDIHLKYLKPRASQGPRSSRDAENLKILEAMEDPKPLAIYEAFRKRVGLPAEAPKAEVFKLEGIPGSEFNRNFLEQMVVCLFNVKRGGSVEDFYLDNRDYLTKDLWESNFRTSLSTLPEELLWEAICVPPKVTTPLLLMDFPSGIVPKLYHHRPHQR